VGSRLPRGDRAGALGRDRRRIVGLE
jgi:hypothetical protein